MLEKLACEEDQVSERSFLPVKKTLEQFLKESPFVFIALHGGIGENGSLQRACAAQHKPFNGPDEKASELCMDKYRVGEVIVALDDPHILSARKTKIPTETLRNLTNEERTTFWESTCKELGSAPLIIKPIGDGCSAGVVLLENADELTTYLTCIYSGEPRVPAGTFANQTHPIELPLHTPEYLLLEEFIRTDAITAHGKNSTGSMFQGGLR